MARTPTIWYAQEGSISIGGRLVSPRVTEIEVSGGERETELIRAFGGGTYAQEMPQGQFETTLTVIGSDITFGQFVMGSPALSNGSVQVSGDGIRQIIIEGLTYTWNDPTDVSGPALRIHFGSPLGTSLSWSQSADGYLEESVTFTCRPPNFKYQSTDNRVLRPLQAL